MLNKIIGFSVKNKLLIALFTLALIIYGAFEVTRLPIDAVPDITNNQVQIITSAPSYGATDIERLVTFPVEQASSNIAGIREIRSYSRFGLSLVTLVFNDDVDIYWARQQVSERLITIQSGIPEGIGKPEMGPISTGLGEIYQYVVKAKKGYEQQYDMMELRTIQDWIVRRQLLGVKGVAEVSSFGGKLKQYEVAINPQKLQAQGISIADVYDALETNNQNTGGSYIEKQSTVLYIRSEGLITGKEDIENVVIRQLEGHIPLLVRDVATVKLGAATRYGALIYGDEGEVSGAIVMMLKGANSNLVIENIKAKIVEIQKTLPEGVIIEPFLDRTKMVNNAIRTVETNLLEGALIVVFVLVLFLGNFRAGMLVASVIPLSMLFAIIMMNQFGVSGNLMSLGALDFGLIVDGAVIIVEAVMHQLHHKKPGIMPVLSQQEMDKEVKSASSKMMNSAVFGQIIILIVYLPIFTLEGIEGKMFKPMAQTVAFALLGAFILSLTYIPMMSSIFLSKKLNQQQNFADRMMEKITSAYIRTLKRVLDIPKTIIVLVLGLFVFSVFLLSRLGGEFIPSIEEGDYAVETRVLSGSNLHTTIENTRKVTAILQERFPEVTKVVTKIGSSEIPTEPLPMDMGDMIINLKPKKEWVSAKTFDELSEKMGKAAAEVPGVTTSFQFPVQMRFNELMTGARQDVVCKIYGEDLDTLGIYAKKLGEIARSISGTAELYVEQITGTPQIVIAYNRTALAKYGLNIGNINKIVNAAFAGQSAGLVYEGEKRFDLVVRLENESRKDVTDVQNLLIPTPNGQQVALNQVATVELADSPSQIQREDTRRRVLVGFNLNGRDVESVVHELQEKVAALIKLPAGYSIGYGGSFENLNKAKSRLSVAVPVSLLLIFLLLYFAFDSIKYGLLIYTAIPLSAIGGILLLAIRGMPFSISAGVGFIALFGIAVLNGIVLIAEFNRIKKEGESELKNIVLRGTATRLRPVLMTAFVASLGFLPMAISNGAGAAVQRPLATVVIGGLMIATLLTLFVLPILYISFEKIPKMKMKKPALTILLTCCFFVPLKAQKTLSLSETLDKALQYNPDIKNRQLRAEQAKQLIKSAYDLPETELGMEYGKFNSNLTDDKFSVNQRFSLPPVYRRRKDLLSGEWKSSLLQVDLKQAEVKKVVTGIFYELLVLAEKQKVLSRIDSMYTELLRVSNLRFSSGEGNMLEVSGAKNYLLQLDRQKKSMAMEYRNLQQQLMLMVNSDELFYPYADSFKLTLAEPDTTALSLHPVMKWQLQEEQLAQAERKLAAAQYLPGLLLGYNNMSMRDGLHTPQNRFHSMQVGVSLPFFTGNLKARVNAAKTQEQIARNESAALKNRLYTELQEALGNYRMLSENVEVFEQSALENAKGMMSVLMNQLKNGTVSYLEWATLNQQAMAVQFDYFDTVRELNNSIIRLNYLLSK